MMKQSKFLAMLILLLLLALAACGQNQAATPTTAPTKETTEATKPAEATTAPSGSVVTIPAGGKILIGGSFALTGPIPDPGKDIAQAAAISIDDINAAGGVLGFQLELVSEDGACDGDAGTAVGNKFAANPAIVAVSGGTCSGETLGLTPVLKAARIPFVSPSATSPKVTGPDCDICNRVAINDSLQGNVDAEFIYNELKLTKLAVIHDNSDYGLGLADVIKARFTELGGTITKFEGIQTGDSDFRAVLTNIATDKPEIIFFGGYSTEAGLIAQQMKEVGMTDTKFISDDGAFTEQFLGAAGPAGEGAYVSFIAGADDVARNAEFDAKYKEKYGTKPEELGPYHAQSYDSILLIAKAIEAVGKKSADGGLTIDREALIKAVRGTTGLAGLSGTLTCNAIGECGSGGIQIHQVTGGKWELIYGFGADK